MANRTRFLMQLLGRELTRDQLEPQPPITAAEVYTRNVFQLHQQRGKALLFGLHSQSAQQVSISVDDLTARLRVLPIIGWTESDGKTLLFRHLRLHFKDNYSVDYYTDTVFPVIGLSEAIDSEVLFEEEMKLKEFEDIEYMRESNENALQNLGVTIEQVDNTTPQAVNVPQTDAQIRAQVINLVNDISPIPVEQMDDLLLQYRHRVGLALIADQNVESVVKVMTICPLFELSFSPTVRMTSSSHLSLSAKLFCFIYQNDERFFKEYVDRIVNPYDLKNPIVGMTTGLSATLRNRRLLLDVSLEEKNGSLAKFLMKKTNKPEDKVIYLVSKDCLLFVRELVSPKRWTNSLLKESTFVALEVENTYVHIGRKFIYRSIEPSFVILSEGVNALQVVLPVKRQMNARLYQYDYNCSLISIDFIRLTNDFQTNPEIGVQWIPDKAKGGPQLPIEPTIRQVMNIEDIDDCVIEWYEPFGCYLLFSLYKKSEFSMSRKEQKKKNIITKYFRDYFHVFVQIGGESAETGLYCYYTTLDIKFRISKNRLDHVWYVQPLRYFEYTITDPQYQQYQPRLDQICQSIASTGSLTWPLERPKAKQFSIFLETIGAKPENEFRNSGHLTKHRFQELYTKAFKVEV